MHDPDIIQTYLDDEQTATQRLRTTARLEQDVALRQELAARQAMIAGLRAQDKAQLRAQLAARLQHSTPPATDLRWPLRKWAAAAAIVLCLGGVSTWLASRPFASPTRLAAYHLRKPYPAPTDKHWAGFATAYEEGDYARAIQALPSYTTEQAAEAQANFYYGLCQLYAYPHQPETAIETLKKVEQTDSPYAEAAAWYLSLALVLDGNEDQAIDQLQTYVHQDVRHRPKARRILRRLLRD